MTYSIVALDRESGELGVGIQSRAFRPRTASTPPPQCFCQFFGEIHQEH